MHDSLPVPLTSFIGREREVSDLRSALRRSRLVTLIGPGGVGKTRLAIEVVRRLRDRSREAVVFADLGLVSEPAAVAFAVASAAGLTGSHASNAEAMLADWLANRALVIVIDNCEHVVGAAASFVAALLGRCPRLRVLATSRESLAVPGEVTWTVTPLNLEEARRLFVARASAARPAAFAATGHDAAVQAICRRLEGIPLALELAAAQVTVLSPAEIVPLLADRFAVVSRTRVPARKQTLRASIEWSHELLTPVERAAFARLAVFTGAFGRDGAAEVAGAGTAMLTELVAKSMIYVVPGPSRTRYRMLDMLRAYGTERLHEAGAETELCQRHLQWWVRRAASVCGHGTVPASAERFEQLCEDIDDLRGALRFAAEANPALGLRLMGDTREVWYRNAQPEGLERALHFLRVSADLGPARAYALITAGRSRSQRRTTSSRNGCLQKRCRAGMTGSSRLLAFCSASPFSSRNGSTMPKWRCATR